jgi:hypothetical protein
MIIMYWGKYLQYRLGAPCLHGIMRLARATQLQFPHVVSTDLVSQPYFALLASALGLFRPF